MVKTGLLTEDDKSNSIASVSCYIYKSNDKTCITTTWIVLKDDRQPLIQARGELVIRSYCLGQHWDLDQEPQYWESNPEGIQVQLVPMPFSESSAMFYHALFIDNREVLPPHWKHKIYDILRNMGHDDCLA